MIEMLIHGDKGWPLTFPLPCTSFQGLGLGPALPGSPASPEGGQGLTRLVFVLNSSLASFEVQGPFLVLLLWGGSSGTWAVYSRCTDCRETEKSHTHPG